MRQQQLRRVFGRREWGPSRWLQRSPNAVPTTSVCGIARKTPPTVRFTIRARIGCATSPANLLWLVECVTVFVLLAHLHFSLRVTSQSG